MENKCGDCGCLLFNKNHKFCSRCLASWYVLNEIDENIPSGDWDDDRSMHGGEEY